MRRLYDAMSIIAIIMYLFGSAAIVVGVFVLFGEFDVIISVSCVVGGIFFVIAGVMLQFAENLGRDMWVVSDYFRGAKMKEAGSKFVPDAKDDSAVRNLIAEIEARKAQ